MSEPAILPTKSGAITAKDKVILRKAGVIVVECDDPASLRLIKPYAELDGMGMLVAALRGMAAKHNKYNDSAASIMVDEMQKMIEANFAAMKSRGS